jgi:hypothetical protein
MAEFAPQCILLGVAPTAKVPFGAEAMPSEGATPDPNHTHFIRISGSSWGDESAVLVGVAERVALRGSLLVLAVAGGEGTERELRLAAERRWPVLLVTGCGGTTDRVAAELFVDDNGFLMQGRISKSLPESTLVSHVDRSLWSHVETSDRTGTSRVLYWRLADKELLKQAWLRFSMLDSRAGAEKPRDRRFKRAVLALAVLATLLAILAPIVESSPGHEILLGGLVGAPLVASILLLLQARRLGGSRWVSFRSAAEAIRREIYRFRTGAGVYGRSDPRSCGSLRCNDECCGCTYGRAECAQL